MILGQLVQTGRRFCECRSKDFIPKKDSIHTILAYCANDRFSARQFDEPSLDHDIGVKDWLEDNRAIAYILISRNFNRSQVEFPPPIGQQIGPELTITAATYQSTAQTTFAVRRVRGASSIRLEPLPQRDPQRSVAFPNYLLTEESAPLETSRAEIPFFGELIPL